MDVLVVIDSLRSSTAERADVVLGELPFFAREGTITSADRRLVRQRPAAGPQRDEREGIAILAALAAGLGGLFPYDGAAEVMAEILDRVAGYLPYQHIASGRSRALGAGTETVHCRLQAVGQAVSNAVGPSSSNGGTAGGGLTVLTGRSLYTSWDGASIGSEEADQLHREESALINPRDAEAAGVRMGDEILLTDGTHELRTKARLDDGVAPGAVYIPHYYDGGAVMSLFPLEGAAAAVASVRVRALQTA